MMFEFVFEIPKHTKGLNCDATTDFLWVQLIFCQVSEIA